MNIIYKNITVIKLIPIVVAIVLGSCSGSKFLTMSSISDSFQNVKMKFLTSTKKFEVIKKSRAGKNGLYYIVDNDGRVRYHKQVFLVGRNYGNLWFMKKILKAKSGCFRYFIGNNDFIIYFEKINSSEILCLSISSSEVPESSEKCSIVINE